MSSSIKHSDEVGEKCLPDAKFKFMQQINNKHPGRIKVATKALNKSILVDNNELLSSVAEVQFSPVLPPFLENREPNRGVCAGTEPEPEPNRIEPVLPVLFSSVPVRTDEQHIKY